MNNDRKYIVLGASFAIVLVIGIFINGNGESGIENSTPIDTSPDDILVGPVFKLMDLRGMEHRLKE